MTTGMKLGCALAATLAVTSVSCDRLSSFDTGPGEAFCGAITLASAYRTGFSPRAQMRLTFDSSRVDVGSSPGLLATYDAEREQAPRLLTDAPLRPIGPLAHDALSLLEFGDGRVRNLIYAVTPTDAEAESLLAVVSLRDDDRVEVRLIRPGRRSGTGANIQHEPLFGLFSLDRQTGDCGF